MGGLTTTTTTTSGRALRLDEALDGQDAVHPVSGVSLELGQDVGIEIEPCGLPTGHVRAADLAPRTNEVDLSHPLYDQTIVFTGALASMSRREAFQRIYDVGGRPGDGVTKETNVLVVGEQDIRRLADGETMSAKQRKARDLRAKGQDIQLIGEDDFLRAL